MSQEPLPHRKEPCSECPWRRDTPPGQFPACRYEALQRTVGGAGAEAKIGAPMFACHKSTEDVPQACAGWLASAGYQHLGIRLAVCQGRLPADALAPKPGWPELFTDYEELSAVMGRPDGETEPAS